MTGRRWVVALTGLLVAVPTCVASAGSGGSADLVLASVTPLAAVIRVGDDVQFDVRYENAGPDSTVCELTASVPDQGPLFALNEGSQLVHGQEVEGVNCGEIASGQSGETSLEFEGVHAGTAAIRIAISPAGPNPASDPNATNDVVTVRVKVQPAKKTFAELREPVFSPDGRTIAYVRWSEPSYRSAYAQPATTGRIWIATANGSRAHPVTPQMPVPRSLSWAANSRALVFSSGAAAMLTPTTWTVNMRTGTLVELGRSVFNPGWSPDGTRIAYLTEGSHGGEIDVIAATGGTPTYVAPYGGTPGAVGAPLVWTPDSRYVLVDGYLFAADGSTSARPTDAVAWSRDGRLMLTRQHTVVDVVSGRVEGSVPAMLRPQLSPDGTAVAGGSLSGRVRIANVATGSVSDAPGAQSAHDTVSWSPLQQLAYVGSGRCGPRSQIDVVRNDGTQYRVVARSCPPLH